MSDSYLASTVWRIAIALALVAVLGIARADLPDLPPGDVLGEDISNLPLDPESNTIMTWLEGAGGFGLGRLQIDFSIVVNAAEPSAPLLPITKKPTYFEPACDVDVDVPVPSGGALEGESGYVCTSGGDCHLIVHAVEDNQLFEVWRADVIDGVLSGSCLATWELSQQYGPFRRGKGCTSADAGGLPIAPLLIDPDEVANDRIDHALRFILPNSRMRADTFVLPATHYGGPSGPQSAPPYGARF